MSGGGNLSGKDRRRLVLLGLPTFGLALAITAVSTYLPTVAKKFTGSTTVIGVLVGGEGIAALILPLFVGAWSDGLRTRWGGRVPLIVAGTPIAVVALLGMGLVGGLGGLALAVGVFFIGYFVAYEPYRALYPDLVDDDHAGRAQSTQAIARGIGTGLALLGGGLLLSIGQAAPFLAAAVLVTASITLFVWLAVRDGVPDQEHSAKPVRETVKDMTGLLTTQGSLRAFFFANALWELALGGVKTFVILWLTIGLGLSLSASAGIVAAVAVVILAGAAFSGKLGDRHGRRRVMRWAALAFGLPMLVPLLTTWTPLLVLAVIPIALGGGALMSLPYALLQPLMPDEHHGALTGFYSASRGLGVMLGPLLGGVAISLAKPALESTQGYAAVWGVCAVALLASLPLLAQVDDPEAPDGS